MDARLLLIGLAWLAIINVAAWTAFALDKSAAQQRERRIPERTLLTLALLGGAPGAVAAQQALRHKTRKEPFRTLLFLMLLAQALALATAVGILRR